MNTIAQVVAAVLMTAWGTCLTYLIISSTTYPKGK